MEPKHGTAVWWNQISKETKLNQQKLMTGLTSDQQDSQQKETHMDVSLTHLWMICDQRFTEADFLQTEQENTHGPLLN